MMPGGLRGVGRPAFRTGTPVAATVATVVATVVY